MAIQNSFLAKSSCSIKSFTHFERDFNLLQDNDLSDANDANHNQIKLDNQSSSMSMLKDILGYSINKQSQMYLEIKAYESIRTRYEYSIYHTRILVLKSWN